VTRQISIFDVTEDMLPQRGRVKEPAISDPFVELRLVRGFVHVAQLPVRDSYGIRTNAPRTDCRRCGIRYRAENPAGLDDMCRDCTEVTALISKEQERWTRK
jgi:hypothetical protein